MPQGERKGIARKQHGAKSRAAWLIAETFLWLEPRRRWEWGWPLEEAGERVSGRAMGAQKFKAG